MYRVLAVFMCVILIACFLQSKHGALQNKAKQLKIKDLLRASSQWNTAARERTAADPVQALVHATSALSFLQAARAIMSDEEIEEITVSKTSIIEFSESVEALQRRCASLVKKKYWALNE